MKDELAIRVLKEAQAVIDTMARRYEERLKKAESEIKAQKDEGNLTPVLRNFSK